MEILLMILGLFVVLGISLLYGVFSWGFVTMKFWHWFLLPVFPALPAISFTVAVGLTLFITLLKGIPAQLIKEEYTDKNTYAVFSIISPWIILCIGWFVKIIIL